MVQRQQRVQQSGLQLDKARHAGHHLARAAVVKQRAKRHQRVAKGVVARERLHRRPRAAIGRAQHQQAATLARHHALPGLGFFQAHGARHQPAHGMRQQPHRLAAEVARAQCRVHCIRQAGRLVFNRAPPVVSEGDDLMRVCQPLDQVIVNAANRAVGLNAGGRGRVPRQLLEAVDEPEPQPDAFAIALEVGAQNARQYKHRRAVRRVGARPAAGTCRRTGGARAAGILPGP